MPFMHSRLSRPKGCVCVCVIVCLKPYQWIIIHFHGNISHVLSMSMNEDDGDGNSQQLSPIYEQT